MLIWLKISLTRSTLVPPNSKESEMMVLGWMLTSINSLNIGADASMRDDFYFTEHRIIFQALKTAYLQRQTSRCPPHRRRTQTAGQTQSHRWRRLSDTLAQYAGTSAYIEEYIELVRR